MRTVTDVNLIDREQWAALAKSSTMRSIFQTREWYDFCVEHLLYEPFVCAVIDDADMLKGVVVGHIQKNGGTIKSFFTRRAIINGGPLLSSDISDIEVGELLKKLVKCIGRRAIYIESRNFSDFSRYKTTFQDNGFKYVPHLNFHIDTTSIDVVQKNLHRNKKRQIKSSYAEGIAIDDNPTIDDLKIFYSILENMYRKKVKTPCPEYSFFVDLYNQDFSKFLFVKKEAKIIGGLVILVLEKDIVYQLYICGEDGVYSNIYPSVVATYAGIQYAVEHECHKCDLMGAGKPNVHYGVRDFKAGFGGELVEHGRFCFITNPLLYRIGKIGVKFLKRFL